jgi:hypothetical protein
MPSLVVPALLIADAGVSTAPDSQSVPQAPVSTAPAAKGRPPARPAQPASSDRPRVLPAAEPAAADVEEPAPSAPAPEASAVITMPDPLVTPASRLRITSSLVRAAARNAARPKPDLVVAEDRLERRIGAWLDWQRSHPSTIDPLRPKYLRPEGRSYLPHFR